MQATKNSHYLDFTYEEYMKNKMSLANCIISKYLIYELIGSGSFGNVYRGMNEETKCPVAVKVIDLELIKK